MADDEATAARIGEHEGERLATPLAGCRRLAMPKVDGKDGALRAPRSAKVVMPFLDEMTDEAIAEMRKRLDADDAHDAHDAHDAADPTAPRTA